MDLSIHGQESELPKRLLRGCLCIKMWKRLFKFIQNMDWYNYLKLKIQWVDVNLLKQQEIVSKYADSSVLTAFILLNIFYKPKIFPTPLSEAFCESWPNFRAWFKNVKVALSISDSLNSSLSARQDYGPEANVVPAKWKWLLYHVQWRICKSSQILTMAMSREVECI